MLKKFEGLTLQEMFSLTNLTISFKEFVRGKQKKEDVNFFSMKLFENLKNVQENILGGNYRHDKYQTFVLMDTKKRRIHKASVKDRIIHHTLYKHLFPYFEKVFVYQSFSCRVDKGPIKATEYMSKYIRKVGKNNTKPVYILKLDIRKCFENVDQEILKKMLRKYIAQEDLLKVLDEIIDSFQDGSGPLKGIPLGNVTSQLFINVYLHELDEFVKKVLCAKYYVRYADDFVILDNSKKCLEQYQIQIQEFLQNNLQFETKNMNKYIHTLSSGVTFLGTTFFPKHKIISKRNKKRFLRRVNENNLHSYLGYLQHVRGHKLSQKLKANVEKEIENIVY